MTLVTSPFATPGHGLTTEVHGFPLPPETRDFRPTYSHKHQYVLPDVADSGAISHYTRVTTGAKVLDDTQGLERWKTRSIVRGLRDNPHLLESIDLYQEPRDVNKELDEAADKAHEAAGGAWASEFGTAVHAWAEAVELGTVTLDQVPEQFRRHVTEYLKTLAKWGIVTPSDPSGRPYVERIVYNSRTNWVGTFDRIYQLADGTWVIGDVKTAKDLVYSYLAISIQLAVYADAEFILSLDGKAWEPMPKVRDDMAVVLWVPSNAEPPKAEAVSIRLDAGREAIDAALAVQDMRRNAKNVIPNTLPIPRPEVLATPRAATPSGGDLEGTHNALRSLLRTCSTSEQMAEVYAQYADVWTPELTALGQEILTRRAS